MTDVLSEPSTAPSPPTPSPPVRSDQEWANAWTHGIAAVAAAIMGGYLIVQATTIGTGMAIACGAYTASVVGTFVCSTASHVVRRQPLLDTTRAWDQAMIYTMISGTYTPIVTGYASDRVMTPLLIAIWVAAGLGFTAKVIWKHRINSIGTASYLALGWLPALPLVGQVPGGLIGWMVVGGVIYTIGVAFLMNDHRARYLHAVWHLMVMAAATSHYWAILNHVIGS